MTWTAGIWCRHPGSSQPVWHGGSCDCVSGRNWEDEGQKAQFGLIQDLQIQPEPEGNALSCLLSSVDTAHSAPQGSETGGTLLLPPQVTGTKGTFPLAPRAPGTMDIVLSLPLQLGKVGISHKAPLELVIMCIFPLALQELDTKDTDLFALLSPGITGTFPSGHLIRLFGTVGCSVVHYPIWTEVKKTFST